MGPTWPMGHHCCMGIEKTIRRVKQLGVIPAPLARSAPASITTYLQSFFEHRCREKEMHSVLEQTGASTPGAGKNSPLR